MSFKMRNRPKKPTYPRSISEKVGDYITVSYLMEAVQAFLKNHEGTNIDDLKLNTEEDYGMYYINIEAPASSLREYEEKLEAYKEEYKVYNTWRKTHKKEIEKHKSEAKAKRATTKLTNRLAKLEQEKQKIEKELSK